MRRHSVAHRSWPRADSLRLRPQCRVAVHENVRGDSVPKSMRAELPFLAASLLAACSPSTDTAGPAAEPPAATLETPATAANDPATRDVEWRFYGGNLGS